MKKGSKALIAGVAIVGTVGAGLGAWWFGVFTKPVVTFVGPNPNTGIVVVTCTGFSPFSELMLTITPCPQPNCTTCIPANPNTPGSPCLTTDASGYLIVSLSSTGMPAGLYNITVVDRNGKTASTTFTMP